VQKRVGFTSVRVRDSNSSSTASGTGANLGYGKPPRGARATRAV
jgi:hypothetical protein